MGLKQKNLKDVVSILQKKLDEKSKPYMNYFLDKLSAHGKSKNSIYVRGALTNADNKVLERLGERKTGYYQCDVKYIKRLQIYLVTGY